MEKTRDLFRLIRLSNLIFVGMVLWAMQHWVAMPIVKPVCGVSMPEYLIWMLIVATMLIAAGGYVINDYFDVKIDRINRPDKLIVTTTFSKSFAMYLSIALSAAGVLIGLLTMIWIRNWSLALIFIMTPGLLWFYSSSYKRQFIVGNLIIAFLAGLTPLLVAFANIGWLRQQGIFDDILLWTGLQNPLYVYLGCFALMAFLCTWIREIVKDLQDQMGDRELECHTIPIRLGEKWTKVILTVLLALTAFLLIYFVLYHTHYRVVWRHPLTRYVALGLVVPLICEAWLLWAARIPNDYRHAQLLMKFIMFVGMMLSWLFPNLLLSCAWF